MDRQFLEFWGRALLQAAQSQKQMEEMMGWWQRNIFSFPDLQKLFKVSYGLDEVSEDTPDYFSLWEKAQENFRQSFREYLSIWGMVPKDDYAALARECEELKAKVAEQEETIQLLRHLLEEKGLGLAATSVEFQKLIEKQGDQFQKFIQGLGEAMQTDTP
ncbi:MAG: hypothetical protein FJ135_00385 [Deltaproteobacteria bacterium]|nr:hypothetical protein [Deltaproteobacteria bacterium]